MLSSLMLGPTSTTGLIESLSTLKRVAVQPLAVSMQQVDPALIPGVGPETANRVFDPFGFLEDDKFSFDPGFSDDGAVGEGNFGKIAWLRHAELKHGRVAMAAFVGYIAAANGFVFKGTLSPSAGISFAELDALEPFAQWDSLPDAGKYQIFAIAGLIEFLTENEKPHYTRPDGKYAPGVVPAFRDTIGRLNYQSFLFKSPQGQEDTINAELKNGRLAMIGIASLYAATAVKGSVPALGMVAAFAN